MNTYCTLHGWIHKICKSTNIRAKKWKSCDCDIMILQIFRNIVMCGIQKGLIQNVCRIFQHHYTPDKLVHLHIYYRMKHVHKTDYQIKPPDLLTAYYRQRMDVTQLNYYSKPGQLISNKVFVSSYEHQKPRITIMKFLFYVHLLQEKEISIDV